MNFQSFSQVSFGFAVTPWLLGEGFSLAVVLGLLGGVLPATRAARLPVVTALREPNDVPFTTTERLIRSIARQVNMRPALKGTIARVPAASGRELCSLRHASSPARHEP